ncbi:Helix-turn-helix [Mycobacteroides abscessus subsp. abscessus]|nr:Helix-turn-helix [Mycobacteroides abscessus subsp. abscessus]
MGMDMFPGIQNPTRADRVGMEVADEQLKLVFGLRNVRVERGLSISDVAETMGVDPAQVSRLESGSTNPTMSTIRRYAKAVAAVFRVEVRKWEDEHRRLVRAGYAQWISDDETPADDEETQLRTVDRTTSPASC